MKQAKITILLGLFLVLIVLSSSAVLADNIYVNELPASNDFIFQAYQENFDLCACQSITEKVTVINTDVFSTKISFSANEDYVSFSQDAVVLAPNQQADVLLRIDVPCNRKRDNTLVIQAHSTANVDKFITQNLAISDCRNVQIGIYNASLQESICEPFTSTIRVENKGPFPEIYSIDVKPYGDYVSLDNQDVLIAPHEYANISARFNLPCYFYGDQKITYFATGKKSKASAKVTQLLHLPTIYNFSLSAPESFRTCMGKTKSFSLTIKNEENFDQNFTLSTKGPNFAKITYPIINDIAQTTILVHGNSSSTVKVLLSPNNFHEGNYSFIVYVTESNKGTTKSIPISLFLDNCYDLSTYIDVPKTKYVCGGDIFEIPLSVHNNGIKNTSVEVELAGTNMLSVDNSSYIVGAESSRVIPIKATINKDIAAAYPITISTKQQGKLIDTHTFTLSVDTSSTCYRIDLLDNSVNLLYDKVEFDLPVKNRGTRFGSYSFALKDAPNFLFLETTSLDLGKTQRGSLKFYVDAAAVAEYLDNQTVKSAIGETVPFKIVMTHDDSQTQYVYDVLFSFKDYSLAHKAFWTIYQTNNCTLLFVVLCLTAIVFFVLFLSRLSKKRHFVFRHKLFVILLIILLLAVGTIFLVYGVPSKAMLYTQHDLSNSTSTHFLLSEDKASNIDLTNLFVDPDNDIVSYGVVGIDDLVLSSKIDGSNLILTPAKDWFGTTWLYLRATDAYNESASSDPILVEVLPVEDYTLKQYFSILCAYFNLVILAILSLFIFLTFSLLKKKPGNTKKQKVVEQKLVQKDVSKKAPKTVNSKKVPTKKKSTKKQATVKKSSKKRM